MRHVTSERELRRLLAGTYRLPTGPSSAMSGLFMSCVLYVAFLLSMFTTIYLPIRYFRRNQHEILHHLVPRKPERQRYAMLFWGAELNAICTEKAEL